MKALIGFEWNGFWILNPFISDNGQDSTSPAHYGFTLDQTGGNCTAWVKRLGEEGGACIVITDGDCNAGEGQDGSLIGLYDGSEEELWGKLLDIHALPSADDLIAMAGGDHQEVIAKLRDGWSHLS